MEYFKKFFTDSDFDKPNNRGEVKVLCPFHEDTKPSANVDVLKSTFYCYVCQKGASEGKFMAEIEGYDPGTAEKLLGKMNGLTQEMWDMTYGIELFTDLPFLDYVTKTLKVSQETLSDLRMGLAMINNVKTLAFPILVNQHIMDIRRYNVLKDKSIAKVNAEPAPTIMGWAFPYDSVKDLPKNTEIYVMEGEKDTLLARHMGLEAICFTGGAGTVPNEFMEPFIKDRNFIICYDNDDAGRLGTQKMANALLDKGALEVKSVDIGELVPEDKGDFADFIIVHEGDIFDFLLLEQTPIQRQIEEKTYKTIAEAFSNNILRTKLTSKVVTTGEFGSTYSAPTTVKVTKGKVEDFDKDQWAEGQNEVWTLDEYNIATILELVEVDAKQSNIISKFTKLLGVPKKEPNMKWEFLDSVVVYRSTVTDTQLDGGGIQVDLYSFDKLNVGGQYEIEYKLYPHPTKNQKVVALATKVEELGSGSDFEKNVTLLKEMQGTGTVKEQVDRLFESTKHYVAKHMNFDIWFITDLVFNSVLKINYGGEMRGALDWFILGDTQVGKSETTSAMTELYKFGHFLSLKTSTTVGLIGGATQVEGSWLNTIGAIPRQHKKLAVLEEFSGAKPDFIKTMTDIRSSGKLRITRASGELVAPCMLRMISISNPINDENGEPRNLSSFPNGIVPLQELIKSAEDITRYDGFLLAPKPETRINPFSYKLVGTPISREAYQHKILWVYTREMENVIWEEGVEEFIWEQAEVLNDMFESNVPIFGTTTSKKLARMSVALASLITSTDETYENIVVTKEIVEYMVSWLIKSYSSEIFKLDKVKKEWQSYSEYDDTDKQELEILYPKCASLLEHLGSVSRTTNNNMRNMSGMADNEFRIVFQQLVALRMIKANSNTVTPTEKFRKLFPIINKHSLPLVSQTAKSTVINDLDLTIGGK